MPVVNSDMVNTAVVLPMLGKKKRETEGKKLSFNIQP